MVLPAKKITKVHKRTKKFIRHQSDRKHCVKVPLRPPPTRSASPYPSWACFVTLRQLSK